MYAQMRGKIPCPVRMDSRHGHRIHHFTDTAKASALRQFHRDPTTTARQNLVGNFPSSFRFDRHRPEDQWPRSHLPQIT